MSVSTATPLPPFNPAEMQVLVARAGLALNPGQMADLVLAWRQLASLLALIPRERALADDQAYSFRLPPPAAPASAPEKPAKARSARAKATPRKPASHKPAPHKPASHRPASHRPASHGPARRKPVPSKPGPRRR